MKRISKIFLSLIFILALFISPSYANDDVLKVGMEVNYAPFNYSEVDDSKGGVAVKNSPGEYANGYDIVMAKK